MQTSHSAPSNGLLDYETAHDTDDVFFAETCSSVFNTIPILPLLDDDCQILPCSQCGRALDFGNPTAFIYTAAMPGTLNNSSCQTSANTSPLFFDQRFPSPRLVFPSAGPLVTQQNNSFGMKGIEGPRLENPRVLNTAMNDLQDQLTEFYRGDLDRTVMPPNHSFNAMSPRPAIPAHENLCSSVDEATCTISPTSPGATMDMVDRVGAVK